MLRFYLDFMVKNLLRHKRRTLLTALAIAAGIFYFILFDSMLTGADRDSIVNLIDLETGHIQVVPITSETKPTTGLKELLPHGATLVEKIGSVPEVKGAASRLLFPATIINGFDELPITGVGVDTTRDPGVFTVNKFVCAGRWVHPGENGAVLGKRIADLLELSVGDTITLRTQTRTLTFQALDLTVVGLITTPDPTVNQGQIFLPLGVVQDALGVGDAVSLVVVRMEPTARLETVAAGIRRLDLGATPVKVETWKEASTFLTIGATKRNFAGILLFLIFLISTIGVINSILLASLERVREIGLLKAMGLREGEIVRLFVFEGLGLGLIGGLIGAVMAIATNLYLVNVGIDLAIFFGKMDMDIGYPITRLYGAWNWAVTFWTILFGIAVSLAASYLPARKAARLDPVESLRRI